MKKPRTPQPPRRAIGLMRSWEDRGHLFSGFMPFLEAEGIAYSTFHMWTKKFPRVGAFYVEARETIAKRVRLKRGMTAVAALGEVRPPKPDLPLDRKRAAFLDHFAKNSDRIDAARAAGMEWEDVERELEEGGVLYASFKKLERRLEIRLRDRLRIRAIEDGNAAVLNALIKHGLMPSPAAPEGGNEGAHDEEDVALYRNRLGILRAAYDEKVVH